MGALTENHRCPRGPFTRMTGGLSIIGLGGVIGAALCYALDERPPGALVIAAAALGGVLASAVRQAVTGRP
jgi:hypothetical protein